MSKTFAVVGKVTGDGSGWSNTLKKTKADTKTWASDLKSEIARIGIGTFMVKGIKDAINFGDKIDQLSKRFGVARKDLQEWDFALKHTGISIDELADAMSKLDKARFDALGGSAEKSKLFSVMGIGRQQLESAPIADLFNSVREQFRTKNFGQAEDTMFRELFGRGSGDLFSSLMKDGFDEWVALAKKLNIALSDKTIKNLADAADNLDTAAKLLSAATAVGVSKLGEGLGTGTAIWGEFLKKKASDVSSASAKELIGKALIAASNPLKWLMGQSEALGKFSSGLDLSESPEPEKADNRANVNVWEIDERAVKEIISLEEKLAELRRKNELNGMTAAEKRERIEKEILAVRSELDQLDFMPSEADKLRLQIKEQELAGELAGVKSSGGWSGRNINELQRIGAYAAPIEGTKDIVRDIGKDVKIIKDNLRPTGRELIGGAAF